MLGLTVFFSVFFFALPELDLWLASFFYEPSRGFFSPENWWLAIPYYGMPRLSQLTALVLIVGWLGSFVIKRWLSIRRVFGFLLAAALIGPHLVVGVGLKDQFGRARPANVEQFGGQEVFTPAFVLSDQCQRNCSFVSAHVASAAFLMAFGWFASSKIRRRFLGFGAVFAAVLGLARMAQGGHFLSDVVLPYFFVYWSIWGTEWLFRWSGWWPLNTRSHSCHG